MQNFLAPTKSGWGSDAGVFWVPQSDTHCVSRDRKLEVYILTVLLCIELNLVANSRNTTPIPPFVKRYASQMKKGKKFLLLYDLLFSQIFTGG